MALDVTGKLFKILPEVTGAGKNGNWVKQEFVIETMEQYPKKACFSVWGDKVASLKGINPGDLVVTSGQLKIKNGGRVVLNDSIQPPSDPNPYLPTE